MTCEPPKSLAGNLNITKTVETQKVKSRAVATRRQPRFMWFLDVDVRLTL